MNDQPPPSFFFAPEIEQALVAAAFQKPERIATIYRELDPAIHITQPHLRQILSAIDLAYRELGSTDFASLIQVLREEGQLQGCGGPQGVNSVLETYRYGFSSPEAAPAIINHYIELLKSYALSRQSNEPVYRFLRGNITCAPNKIKRNDKSSDFIGQGKVAGRTWSASAWIGPEGLYISVIPR